MTAAEWEPATRADRIQPGETVEAEYQGMRVIGLADHRNADGAWFTAELGLLVPPLAGARFRVIPPPRTTLSVEIGTIVWAVTDTFEGALEFREDECWWTRGPDAMRMWSPGDEPLALNEWQLIRGKVAEA